MSPSVSWVMMTVCGIFGWGLNLANVRINDSDIVGCNVPDIIDAGYDSDAYGEPHAICK